MERTAQSMTDPVRRIQEKILPVLHRYDVIKAGIFGSYATGNPSAESDLDLLIEFKGQKSLLDLIGLKLELEEMLKRRVDVATYNSIHKKLRRLILAQQIRIL